MNWIKITREKIHEMHDSGKIKGIQKSNLWTLYKNCKENNFLGLYLIKCDCRCGTVHDFMMAVRTFEGHPEVEEKYKKDEKPRVMCLPCKGGLQQMIIDREDPKTREKKLKWKGPDFDCLPGMER